MASTTLPFSGKTVLITGGSKGIGGATSLLLAKQGANIAFNYSSDSAAANELVDKIGDAQRCLALKADASSISAIEKIVALTVEKFGKIDILIPCAGVLAMKGLEDTTEEDFDKTYNLNVKGPYFLAQVCPIRVHWDIADSSPESRSPHACWLAHCISIDISHNQDECNSKLYAL